MKYSYLSSITLFFMATKEAKGTIFVAHGGGFRGGSPSYGYAFAKKAKGTGFDVVLLSDINKSNEETLRILDETLGNTYTRPYFALGISSGGFIATQLYLKAPTLFRSVILIAPVLDPVKRCVLVSAHDPTKAATLQNKHRTYFGGDMRADEAAIGLATGLDSLGHEKSTKVKCLVSSKDTQAPYLNIALCRASLVECWYPGGKSHSELCKEGPPLCLESLD